MAALNPEIAEKFRKATKLPRRQQGDGHEIEVEVREDEEQSVKFQEIIDLLVAAGYFRARIKGLPSFDKVIGGMTWCIESLNVDVDVDLLFQENSTIGQKIALTEKIVAVLPKIKCPHRIEPHQIQGLDFIHIFPVVQWLVKRSVEFRQEQSAYVRSYAVNQFNKEFTSKLKSEEGESAQLDNIRTVSEVYRPQRRYKRKTAPPPDIESRVQITLLEYGHRGETSQSLAQTSNEKEIIVDKQKEESHIQQLLSSLTATQEVIPQLEQLSEEDRERIEKHYESLQLELKDGGLQSKEHQQIEELENQIRILTEGCSKLENHKKCLEDEIIKEQNNLEDIRLKQTEVERALEEFEEVENKNPDLAKEVKELIAQHEELRNQEIQFRDNCKQEKARLEKEIRKLKQIQAPAEPNPELQKDLQETHEKLKMLRLKLAKKNRNVAILQRQLDDVPNRAELAQYQRRFIELYNQVAAKHKETKQYYSLYNSLVDKRAYMQKELSILNSISDSYPEAMQSANGKEEFLKQFQNIVEGVRQSRMKAERRVSEEKQKRDQLSHTLQRLMDIQRRYVTSIKELSIECQRFEALSSEKQGK